MKTKNSVLLMLCILLIEVMISILLIFLDSNLPVLITIITGIVFTIIIDSMLLYKKPKVQKKQMKKPENKNSLEAVYTNLLKTSIDLNDKITKLTNREKEIKEIIDGAKKINTKKQNNLYKHIKHRKRYIASINSDKFHERQCKFTKLISPKNKLQFATKTQALKYGLKPCNELKR